MKKIWKLPFWVGIASLAWFILRVVPKPARIMYPCQRIAVSQMSWAFPAAAISAFAGFWGALPGSFRRGRVKTVFVMAAAACAVLLFSGSGRSPAIGAPAGITVNKNAPRVLPLKVPDKNTSLVSFRHDPSAYYGRTPPYDEKTNPAYGIVCRAVEDLGLGSASNPLEGFITGSDTVLIKPNLLGDKQGMYTHPAVVRPIIDMCVRAGAKTILVGDGGPGYIGTEAVMRKVGYSDMIEKLRVLHPGILIKTVNMHDMRAWHWVNAGEKGMFHKSGYSDKDLADAYGHPLKNYPYYSRKDPQGVNPLRKVMGWYAISDHVLKATVVINVPKMKCHDYMINSLCLKNNVGITLGSTVNEADFATWRIPHVRSRVDFLQAQYETNFGNDIFWRAISDVNRILLYADSNGVIRGKRQRKYLNIVDAVEASEVNQYGDEGLGGGKLYRGQAIFAGTDPVAVDCAASRFMGYDWRRIPVIANAAPDGKNGLPAALLPLGTNDPSRIRMTGDELGTEFRRVFGHSANWGEYTEKEMLDIIDFDPPAIHSVRSSSATDSIKITASATGAASAFLYYEVYGQGYSLKMQRHGSEYTAVIPKVDCEYLVQAQDKYFNTARTPFYGN